MGILNCYLIFLFKPLFNLNLFKMKFLIVLTLQLASGLAIDKRENIEELNGETNGDFTIEPIDLNSLDLIQANKEDTVRVPIRQLRQLLQLAIKEDRNSRMMRQKESEKKSNRRESRKRLRSANPSNPLPYRFDLRG